MICINDELERIGSYSPRPDDELLVCRCEEITKGEIRRAVHAGIFTLEEMRRWLRNGMGLCQGKTCEAQVKSIIAAELGVSPTQIAPSTGRAPMRPIEMYIFGNDGGEKSEDKR